MSLLDDPAYIVDLNSQLSHSEIGEKYGKDESVPRRHRKKFGIPTPVPVKPLDSTGGESEAHNADGSSSYVRFSEQPWGHDDYRAFIQSKGQNPDEVTFTWGWTSNPAGGFWNKLNNVKPKASSVEEAIDWASASKFIENVTYIPAPRDYLVNTAILQPTDEQWGKTDFAGGTPETEQRVMNSYSAFCDYIKEYRPRQVLLARTGDGIENVCSTNSQRDTNDLDVPHMLVQSYKMDLRSLSMIAPLVEEVIDARVPSNHGRFRTGLKQDSGNPHADFGIGVGRQIQDTQNILGVLPNVRVVFPDALMESMTVQLDTFRAGLVHGHQAGGPDKMGDWWGRQDHGRMPTWDADILFVGHWHSWRTYQSGDGRWVVVGPASDPGSSWFSNLKGERATAGMLAVAIEGKRMRFPELL